MRDSVWPHYAMAIENASFVGYEGKYPTDNSFIGNHQLGDMFLRIPDDQVYTPYIAHTELDGFVLVHGHPLNGTKFFTWGQSGPGRFMQDFLAAGGKGNGYYTELQTGPAPSQMQTFPMPANSNLEWTEWFKAFDGSSDVLRGADYQKALGEVDAWMKSGEGMPKESVDDWDAFFSSTFIGCAIRDIGNWSALGCIGRKASWPSVSTGFDIYTTTRGASKLRRSHPLG